MTIEFERFAEPQADEVQKYSRVKQFASWVVGVYTLPDVDKTPALRHDFPGQQSQVPNFQYGDWFERQPADKQTAFGD